jgi:X-X-X-Leu-X-X-Gly heptad repeat protein
MFGMKTLVVGGGAAALLWMMNTHASAGDLVDDVKNGASKVSDGYQSVSTGVHDLSDGASNLQHALPGDNGSGLSGPAVEITPSAARPGMQVLITVPTCIQPESGTATSAVFTNNGSVSLTRNPKGPGLAGVAGIVSNAQNGQWSVNVTCGTGANKLNGVTSITIFGGVNPAPTSPPKAGGGGSVMKGDVGMTAGGLALVAGGVGYGLWTMRRREASGTHAG